MSEVPAQTPMPSDDSDSSSSSVPPTPQPAAASSPRTPAQELSDVAQFLQYGVRPLGAPMRLEVLGHLLGGPLDVTALTQRVELEMPQVSKALAALKRLGVVSSRIEASRRVYQLTQQVRCLCAKEQWHVFIDLGHACTLLIGFPAGVMTRLHPEGTDRAVLPFAATAFLEINVRAVDVQKKVE